MKKYTSAIILAAGCSSRMKSINDKLLLKIGNLTIFEKVISIFQNAETIDEIIIVTNKEKSIIAHGFMSKYNKISKIKIGGSTRTESANIGVQNISDNCEYICFHDCARPFISSKEIDRLNNIAYLDGNVICGKKASDTIKIIDSNNKIINTPNRNYCICAQTPQIFKKTDYKNSLLSIHNCENYTDDAQILENNNILVSFVECMEYNEKITTDNDILLIKNS